MTTVTELDPDGPLVPLRPAPRPLGSALVAAASRITKERVNRTGASSEGWQEDAWDMHDLVGEQRFLAHTLAGRMAQARFFVGRMPKDSTQGVEVLEGDHPAKAVFDAVAGTRGAFSQIIERAGINLFIPGDCWFVGVPRDTDGDGMAGPNHPSDGLPPVGQSDGPDLDGVALEDLDWSLRSISEVVWERDGEEVTIKDGVSREGTKYRRDDVILIRIWRPHPRFLWQADSPTRSSLPVLRELVGLTMHISAQVDSRLAGAGVFFVPESADRALRAQNPDGTDEEGGEDISPMATALMEAMLTPIADRSSASALVPVMPVVPDESIPHFRHISFAVPLDAEARSLRDEAIRRLALGQDCPPELLLGVGGMNHWGAWLVREDVVTSHLEPPLALICDALTTQLLWPVLEQQGVEDFQDFVIWYDVSHLIIRPDRSSDAKDLHARGVISDAALRAASGFGDEDAPEERDEAVFLALQMVASAPTLLATPGLTAIVEQIRAALSGQATEPIAAEDLPSDEGATPPADEESEESNEGNLPDTADDSMEEAQPGLAASGHEGPSEPVRSVSGSVLYDFTDPPVSEPPGHRSRPIFGLRATPR